MVYLYAAELFPTVLRNSGVGSSSMCARIGSIIAPIVGGYLGEISTAIPVSIFATCSFVAGIVTLFLPETKGRNLPDTLEEGRQFGKGENAFTSCCSKSKSNGDSN